MSDVAIRCEGIGKQYRIGAWQSYKTLREALVEAASAPLRRLSSLSRNGRNKSTLRSEAFVWALQDVSFEVRPGEVLGIIGRNGAGKSTLLKVLSRITEPTVGHAEVHGRVGSLLEVGTGFHPELTGRENVYLNGAILGMRKAEIARKFDEIVAFAEVEKFIDTPVKRYSSGMYARLAFAVAAHLETEILLVDEVLAVGDIQFQQKCLGKMEDVSRKGRTVLFVSHNMAAMRSLCSRVVYLGNGRVKVEGETNSVIDAYSIEAMTSSDAAGLRSETTHFLVDGVDVEGEDAASPMLPLCAATVRVRVRCKSDCPDLTVRLTVEEQDGRRLVGIDAWTMCGGVSCPAWAPRSFEVHFPSLPLAPGNYVARMWLVSYLLDVYEELPYFIPLTVHEGPVPGCQSHERSEHGILATEVIVSGADGSAQHFQEDRE